MAEIDFTKYGRRLTEEGAATGSGQIDFAKYGKPVPGTPPRATGREAVSATLEGAAGGAVEFGGAIPGMMLGAKAGTAAAPFLGPAAPLGPPVGAALGLGYSLWAGKTAREGLGLRQPTEMPPELRPFGYGGESFGGAVTSAVYPYAAAATGFRFAENAVGSFLNQIINTAKTQPLRFGAAEVTTAASAATGAGLAEVVAPGQADVRIGAELAGGILNPTKLTMDAVSYGVNTLKRAATTFSPAARETAAARTLTDLFRVTGEDPEQVALVLKQLAQDPAMRELTSGQITGSTTLAALEDYLRKHSAQFGVESRAKAEAGLEAMRVQISLLTATGDPQALKAAGEIKTAYFRTLIQSRVDAEITNARTAAGRIVRNTAETRGALATQARTAIEGAITDVRAAERQLWEAVDGAQPVQVTNLQREFNAIVGDLLPEVRNQKTPAVVRQFLDRMTRGQGPTFDYDPVTMTIKDTQPTQGVSNVKEMRQLRSELLDLARQSTNAGEFGQARIYSNLAESVLDDMDAAFAATGDTAYDAARTFSREMNDVFTRSFVGKVSSQGRYGDRVAPELTLRRALAGGSEAAAIQLDDLEQATRFMLTRGLGDDLNARAMLDAQERYFRIAAAESIDPNTGRFNPVRLENFMKQRPELLRRFPDVQADLRAALSSEQSARRLENLAKGQINVIEQQKVFGRVANGDPVNLASRALLSKTSESDLIDLIKVAKAGTTGRGGRILISGDEAVRGLKASIFTAAMDRSTRSGVLDIDMMRQFLFNPTRAGQKSAMQVLQEQGVIKPDEVKTITRFFEIAQNIQRASRPTTTVEVKTDLTDAAVATISRMIGSGIAGTTARAAGSNTPSLIVHGAGARLAETAMTKIPTQSVRNILIEAMNDPQKMQMLLTKVDTPEQAAFQARQIHAWLVQSGLMATSEQMEQQPQQPTMFSQPR
jgi:hypothetical protein